MYENSLALGFFNPLPCQYLPLFNSERHAFSSGAIHCGKKRFAFLAAMPDDCAICEMVKKIIQSNKGMRMDEWRKNVEIWWRHIYRWVSCKSVKHEQKENLGTKHKEKNKGQFNHFKCCRKHSVRKKTPKSLSLRLLVPPFFDDSAVNGPQAR